MYRVDSCCQFRVWFSSSNRLEEQYREECEVVHVSMRTGLKDDRFHAIRERKARYSLRRSSTIPIVVPSNSLLAYPRSLSTPLNHPTSLLPPLPLPPLPPLPPIRPRLRTGKYRSHTLPCPFFKPASRALQTPIATCPRYVASSSPAGV